MDAFEAYGMFLAMRAHFTQPNYSYHRYNGKIRTSMDKFMARNDRYFFHKLSKREDPESYALAQFIEKPDVWITSFFTSDADENYERWKNRRDALVYNFERDLGKLDDDFNSNLRVVGGLHPPLLELYLEKEVCHETMVVLNELTGAFNSWNAKISDDVVWPAIFTKLRKYRAFMKLDDKKDRLRQKILDRWG